MTVPPTLSKMQIFGITLAMALSMSPVSCPLSVVELWSGVGSIAKAAECAGYQQLAMDKDRIPGVTDVDNSDTTENIMTKAGFMKALQAVLQIKKGGLLWMAPVCSSFVFTNSYNCQRSVARPAGNTAYGPVKEGNFMASIAAFLYAVAMLRGVHPVIEQPAGSIMFRHKPLAKVLKTFQHWAATCARCHFQVDAVYGQRFLKRYKFVGEAWVRSLQQNCTCPGAIHKALVRKDKRGGVSGDAELLKESQSYPWLLGKWVVDNWLEHCMLQPTVQNCTTVPLSTVNSSKTHWQKPNAMSSSAPEAKKRITSGAHWKSPGASFTSEPIAKAQKTTGQPWKRPSSTSTSMLDAKTRSRKTSVAVCSSWKHCK